MLSKTIQTVEDAILEGYLETKEPLTVPEIREQCGLSATVIRKVVDRQERIQWTEKSVKIMSKNYPHMIHQWRNVSAYFPKRRWLADIINKTRLELPHYKYDQKYRG